MKYLYKAFFLLSFILVLTQCQNQNNNDQNFKSESRKNHKILSQRKAYVKGQKEQDSPNEYAKYFKTIRTKFGYDEPDYPLNYKFDELKKARSSKRAKTSVILPWESRGPGNVGGRTRGLIIDPDDPTANTWYAAAVGGGVWKTTDAGVNWTSLAENDGVGSLAASYMAMAPSNHDLIYLGTGEGFGNLDALGGQGLWRSYDRGQTWSQLSNTISFGIINRIIIDPNNENTVVIATNKGIYKTTNAGFSWEQRYQGSKVYQLIYEPGNFSVQYAATSFGKVLKSITGGLVWDDCSIGIAADGRRVEIAISPVNPSVLYASIDYYQMNSKLYKTTNGGTSWTNLDVTTNLLGGQGWYDNCIIAHPFDENVCFVGGINLYKITTITNPPATSVVTLTNNYGSNPALKKGTHVDNHYFEYAILDNNAKKFRLLSSNDGGVCYTDDEGSTYKQPSAGYVTTQFYGVDKVNGSDKYLGGMQDNSCYISPENPNSSSNWTFAYGGDGFDVISNYKDPNKFMLTSQYNYVLVTHNNLSSAWNAAIDQGDQNSGFWTKLAQSKQLPDLVFAKGVSGIWRTDNFGTTWENIAMPSNYHGEYDANEIKISLINPAIVWTGNSLTNSFPLYLSLDFGKTFNKLPSSNLAYSFFSGFATHPADQNTAYALFSSSGNPKILRTEDLGQTWTDITQFVGGVSANGFPNVAVFDLLVMPYNNNIIWAATEIGIVESTDNGATWNLADNGLPPVAIYEMLIVNNEVVLGTHGRGVYSVELPELAGYEPPQADLPPVMDVKYKFDGKQYASGSVTANSDYESFKVYLDDNLVAEKTNGVKGDVIDVNVEIAYGSHIVKAETAKSGIVLKAETSVDALNLKDASSHYANTFNLVQDLSDEFSGQGFYLSMLSGFVDKSINTQHPYTQNKDLYLYLNTPIVVDAQNPDISYKDIAILEKGDPGVLYPQQEFWDYATLEASSDGQNWVKIIQPYDANLTALWSSAYDNNTNPNKDYFHTHNAKITDYFSDGQVVLFRFMMHSDEYVTGWGWMIDDLIIQNGQLSSGNTSFQDLGLKVFPNPLTINSKIAIDEKLSNQYADYYLHNVSGQIIFSGRIKLSSGTRDLPFDPSRLASGTYNLVIKTDKHRSSIKLVKN